MAADNENAADGGIGGAGVVLSLRTERPTHIAPATSRQYSSFDYGSLASAPETGALIRNATQRIRAHQQNVAQAIIAIGVELLGVKEHVGHGRFGAWLEAEFSWTEKTAQRFMNAARAFRANPTAVSDMSPTTIYLLSSAPASVRNEIVRRREEGEQFPDRTIKLMVAEAKTKAGKDRRRQKHCVRKIRSSPADVRRAEKRRQEEEARSTAALAQAAALIRERVGDALPELLRLFEEAGPVALFRLPKELRGAAP